MKFFYGVTLSRVGNIFTCNMFHPGQIDLDQGYKNRNFATWIDLRAKLISKQLSWNQKQLVLYTRTKQKNYRDTSSKGADTKRKTSQTSKGGSKRSDSWNTRVNKSHNPKNSNLNTQHGQTNVIWPVTLVPSAHTFFLDTGVVLQYKDLMQ